jgi:hypothetical protein
VLVGWGDRDLAVADMILVEDIPALVGWEERGSVVADMILVGGIPVLADLVVDIARVVVDNRDIHSDLVVVVDLR